MTAADSTAAPAAPRRLLIVTDEMEVGGSQRQIVHLIEGLDRSRWQPELLYFRKRSFLLDRIEAGGTPIHQIPKRGRIDAAFLLALVRFLRSQRYDLVHCFSITAELWVRIALSLLRRPPFIASMRDIGAALSDRQWIIKRWSCRAAAAVISNSKAAADRIRAELGDTPPVHVVANGITIPERLDPAGRQALRADLGMPADRPCALFVGRLVHQKNVDLLLEALAALPPERRPLTLLAGNGALRASLDQVTRRLGLGDHVRFLGERSDSGNLMLAADFLVLPSREEGLSNVVLEAMAAGLPVVASRVGGNVELISDSMTGLLFPSEDAAALTAQLERICSDPALRRQLGEAAREDVSKRFSIAEMARRTETIYQQVLQKTA